MYRRESKKEAAYIDFDFALWLLADDKQLFNAAVAHILQGMFQKYGAIPMEDRDE